MTTPDAAGQHRLYGRRRGRPLRPGQRLCGRVAAAPRDRLPETGPLDPAALFPARRAAVWLEIGFGAGEHLAAQAEAHPETGFIGCEVFENGVARLVAEIARRGLANVRIFPDDARLLLDALAPASLGGCLSCSPIRGRKRGITSAGWSRPRRWTGLRS